MIQSEIHYIFWLWGKYRIHIFQISARSINLINTNSSHTCLFIIFDTLNYKIQLFSYRLMQYQFVLKKRSSSLSSLLNHLVSILNQVIILKVQPLPPQNKLSMGSKNLLISLKGAIKQTYMTNTFQKVQVACLMHQQFHVWKIVVIAQIQELRKLQGVEIIENLFSLRIQYQHLIKNPIKICEFSLQNSSNVFFNNNNFELIFRDQLLEWTYSDNLIVVSIIFTYKLGSRVRLLFCFKYVDLDVKYYSKQKQMHLLVYPNADPQFYLSQMSFDSYQHPLLGSHHQIINIFYPAFAKEHIFLRLIIQKSQFNDPQFYKLCKNIKQTKSLAYQRIQQKYKPADNFNYQFYYQSQKKTSQTSIINSYFLSSKGLEENTVVQKISGHQNEFLVIVINFQQHMIPWTSSRFCTNYINEQGEIEIQSKIYKIVGALKHGSFKRKLFMVSEENFKLLKIDWNNKIRLNIQLFEKMKLLGSINCKFLIPVSPIQQIKNCQQQSQKTHHFLGWINSKVLKQNTIYSEDVAIKAKINNTVGILFCRSVDPQIQQHKTQQIDLEIYQQFSTNEMANKIAILEIDHHSNYYLTDSNMQILSKLIPLNDLIIVQRQIFQTVLYYFQRYLEEKMVHKSLSILAPLYILKNLNLSQSFKVRMVEKFQKIKNILPIGIQIQVFYNSTQTSVFSSLKGQNLFIFFKGGIFMFRQQNRLLRNSQTQYISFPSNYKGVFGSEKIIWITNEHLIQKLNRNKPPKNNIFQLAKYCCVPDTYSYKHFVRQIQQLSEFHSLFKNDLKLRNPFMRKQIPNKDDIKYSNKLLQSLNCLVSETVVNCRCQCYIDLIIEEQNLDDLYHLGKAYRKQALRASEASRQIEQIKGWVKQRKRILYPQIHELFLLNLPLMG